MLASSSFWSIQVSHGIGLCSESHVATFSICLFMLFPLHVPVISDWLTTYGNLWPQLKPCLQIRPHCRVLEVTTSTFFGGSKFNIWERVIVMVNAVDLTDLESQKMNLWT